MRGGGTYLTQGDMQPEFTIDHRAMGDELAERLREFRRAFGIAYYSPNWQEETERVAEALTVEYGKLLLAEMAQPPILVTRDR
jgi:hypothetical protein